MAAHRAPSPIIAGERYVSPRLATIIGFSIGWCIWMWGRAAHGSPAPEDLSTYPGGIVVILGIYRSLEGAFGSPVVPKET